MSRVRAAGLWKLRMFPAPDDAERVEELGGMVLLYGDRLGHGFAVLNSIVRPEEWNRFASSSAPASALAELLDREEIERRVRDVSRAAAEEAASRAFLTPAERSAVFHESRTVYLIEVAVEALRAWQEEDG